MAIRQVFLCLSSVLVASLYGCGIGYNRMLFVTKTNVGFEADTKPPSLQLAIGRLEGLFAPQFQGGKKLPVMASFKFESDRAFSPSVGSAFSTGDAALALSSLYADRTPPGSWQDRLQILSKDGLNRLKVDSALTLNEAPKIDSWFATLFEGGDFQGSDVRPVFFGTDTSLGIKLAWSGLTSYVPDTARFGYGRKELAWVPVTMEKKSDTEYRIKTSSLLATLDSGVSQPTLEGGQPSAPLSYVQYFASGDAATLLAMQQTVRQAMLARLDPHAKARAGQFAAELAGEAKVQAMVYLGFVYQALQERAKREGIKQAEALAKALDPLGKQAPQSYVRYVWNPKTAPPLLEHRRIKLPGADQRRFSHALQYWGDTTESLKAFEAIKDQLKADPKFAFQELRENATQPVNVTAERATQLIIEFTETAEAFAKFDQQLRSDPAVIEAATYFIDTMLSRK